MRKTMNLPMFILQLFLIVLPGVMFAQNKTTNTGSIVINGTSNIHDWVMESKSGYFSAAFTTDVAGMPTAVTNLIFSVPVTSLKSEKGSTMDNNAYKAMNSEKAPYIKFSAASATVKPGAAGAFTVVATGKLSINNTIRDVTLTAAGRANADKSISLDGTYNLNTNDYGVKPISIMLGAIKTSADVKITYQLNVK